MQELFHTSKDEDLLCKETKKLEKNREKKGLGVEERERERKGVHAAPLWLLPLSPVPI